MTFYYPLPQGNQSTVTYDCNKCGICDNPKLLTPDFPTIKGDNYNGLVILGQQPSKEDDQKSIPFSNTKAQAIRANAFKLGINLKKVGAFMFALQGYSSKKPTDVQFKCCRENMVKQLIELRPKMVICCGEMAFKSLFDLKNKIPPTKIRGRLIPNYEFNCLVYTLMNPNDLYNYDQQDALKRDLKRGLKFHAKYGTYKKVDGILKERKILDGITIKEVKNEDDLDDCFEKVSNMKRVAFDYETTNVKPFDENFEITHIQFGTASYAWVLHESLWLNDPDIWYYITEFLSTFLPDPSIEKIIQNVKFERNCSRYIFNTEIVNTQDPMIASHVIDERRGTTSLDFQNLTRFGIPPYSDTVKSFLMRKDKDDKQNRIREAPYDDMIIYGGLDVITTYNQWLLIEKILPKVYPDALANYKFLHRGHKLFANMTHSGIMIDEDELIGLEEELEGQMENVLEKITNIPEFKEYDNYLIDKNNLSKSTDKKLESLSVKMKGDGTYDTDATGEGSNLSTGKPIRRKLSF